MVVCPQKHLRVIWMRKTQAQRNQEFSEKERRVWDEFRPKLESLASFIDAQLLVASAPPPDSPGRRYYSNLGFFLQSFAVPMGSSRGERAMYLQFIRRLDAAGALNPGAAEPIIENLQRALAAGYSCQ